MHTLNYLTPRLLSEVNTYNAYEQFTVLDIGRILGRKLEYTVSQETKALGDRTKPQGSPLGGPQPKLVRVLTLRI
jgi:hypothetical protein